MFTNFYLGAQCMKMGRWVITTAIKWENQLGFDHSAAWRCAFLWVFHPPRWVHPIGTKERGHEKKERGHKGHTPQPCHAAERILAGRTFEVRNTNPGIYVVKIVADDFEELQTIHVRVMILRHVHQLVVTYPRLQKSMILARKETPAGDCPKYTPKLLCTYVYVIYNRKNMYVYICNIYIYMYIWLYNHVYIYICMYACMHVCMCACVHVCMCACVHVCMCACVHVCMCVCVCVCMYVMYVCMYVYMYVCMYDYVWLCMYVCMYDYV